MARLTEAEYASIVDAAAASTNRVVDASTSGGFHARVKVQPKSGKGHWEATCSVDPDTGHLTIFGGHQDSASLRIFVDKIHL